jgi:cell division protein ZapA (FtsZ GTPase activity inhibitor)
MAALNMANELLRMRERDHTAQHDAGTRIRQLRERVETALQNGQQLEL